MVTMARRIAELRSEKGVSRPELAAALGVPRMSVEKFEDGRQTPSQAQQEKLAAFFAVPLSYLRGEDPSSDWMDGAFLDAPQPPAPQPPRKAEASGGGEQVLDALLGGRKFQAALQAAVLEALRSPEGQELLAKAVRRELRK